VGAELPDKYRRVNDEKWLLMLIKSICKPRIGGVDFPGFPENAVQIEFVGSANKDTLCEAFSFYSFLKEQARDLGRPLERTSRFLDFGCGWGRYLRFFWKDIDEKNLYGVDVDQSIVDLCHSLNVPGQVDHIEPLGVLPYPDSCFDAIMAYSVFTHLPETVHMHWIAELARVASPGCVFCLTLEPRRFIDFISALPEDPPSDWHKMLSKHKPRLADFYDTFDAGNLAFMPTNAGVEDLYGDAVVPLAFIEKNWTPYFAPRKYVDDSTRFWQAVLVAQRV
jgi:hypothetical protein